MLNPLNYSLAEISKALIALVGLAGYVVLLFVTFDPSLIQSIELLIPAVFAVIGTFAAKNHSTDDLQKALMAAIGAIISIVSYFHTVPADTANKIGLVVGAIVIIVGIYWKANAPATE